MPAAPDFSCDLDALMAQSKCFSNLCLGEFDLLALDMWVRIQTLKAVGGPDYTNDLHGLLEASKKWQHLSDLERKRLSLYIDVLDAMEEGVTDPDVNDVLKQAQCYKCLGLDLMKNTNLYLKCATSSYDD